MQKILFVISLFAALCFAGCNFNESDSQSNNLVKLLFPKTNSLRVTDIEITQYTVLKYDETGSIVEIPRLTLKWKVSGSFSYMQFTELNSGKVHKSSSKYIETNYEAKFSEHYKFQFIPVIDNQYGESYIVEYTADPEKSLEIEGNTLPEGTLEVDCTMADGEYKVFELNKSTLSLKNAKDTTVYVTRFNPSENDHSASRSVLKSTDKLSSSSRSTAATDENCFSEIENLENGYEILKKKASNPTEAARYIHPEIKIDRNSIIYPEETSRASNSYPLNYELGDRRTVYASKTAEKLDISTETTATLQYKSDRCYVWVVDGYFTEGKPGNAKINRATCEEIGKKFDEIMDLERNIFGMESEMLIVKNQRLPMETNSETGTMVNILMYDILGDYTEGAVDGIYGFFTDGDYYLKGTCYNSTAFSNGGKYLHIDSGFASDEKNLPIIYDVAVHEFQHMIYFGQKNEAEHPENNSMLTEMCSLLAEDLFQEKLSLSDMECGKIRFMHLTLSWRYFPLFKWDEKTNDSLAFSYANAYGIGSYVAKKYGGADFIYDFMHNDTYGLESFLDTIKQHDPTATKESLLRDFCTEMCTCSTFNTTVESKEHVMDGYSYPMTNFDFKNFQAFPEYDKGPFYTSLTKEVKNFQPNQIDISKIQRIEKDSEKLFFYGKSEDQIKEYIVIVKE